MKHFITIMSLLLYSNDFVVAQISDGNSKIDIIHLNVGQGDATLILGPKKAGKRVAVLYDAGEIPSRSYDGGEIVLKFLRANNIDKLDYFINSHHHSDHIGGVAYGWHGQSFVLGENNVAGADGDDDNDGKANWTDSKKNVPDADEIGMGDDIIVDNYIDRGDDPKATSKTFLKYERLASASNRIKVETQAQVNSTEIDLGGDAKMFCVASNGYVRDGTKKVTKVNTENERSVSFWLQYDKFNYLIGGDINGRDYASEDAEVEKEIGEYLFNKGIKIDVLQVNHHGANNTSESDFLYLIKPKIAVISCGDGNGHGHPHPEALERLVKSGVEYIYQTEYGKPKIEIPEYIRKKQVIAHGHIYVSSDGDGFDIQTVNSF